MVLIQSVTFFNYDKKTMPLLLGCSSLLPGGRRVLVGRQALLTSAESTTCEYLYHCTLLSGMMIGMLVQVVSSVGGLAVDSVSKCPIGLLADQDTQKC